MKLKDSRSLLLWTVLGLLLTNLILFLWGLSIPINPMDQGSILEQIDIFEKENSYLRGDIISIMDSIKGYNEGMKEGLSTREILEKDLTYYKMMSGKSKVWGEGLIVILNDSEEIFKEGTDKNTYLIHDYDVNKILTDLRNAGAEAMEVNGERVVFQQSEIQCNGPTIQINRRMYSQPYIIKAIGNRNRLKNALTNVDSYGYKLKQFGLFVEANTSIYLEISGFDEFRMPSMVKEEEQ